MKTILLDEGTIMRAMQEHVRTITTKGQVSIPAEVRRILGVKPHDKLVFRITEDNRVELQPTTMSLEDTFASVPPLTEPLDDKQMRDLAIEEHVQHVIDTLNQ